AVLINAGLLALLFMMAINTDEEVITNQPVLGSALVNNQTIPTPTPPSSSQSQAHLITSPVKILADAGSADEMDNFLKDFSTNRLQSVFVDDEGAVDLDNELMQSIPPERTEDIKAASDTRIVEVTVKRGDALEKIARSNGTTVEIIKKINNLSSSKLIIGQVLRIPVPVTSSAASPRSSSVANASANLPKASTSVPISEANGSANSEIKYYTIKSGDNPWKIAKEHKVKYDDILKWNGMDEEKARSLKVGDKIRVK
ncbi:MAG: LysM peptidoglycan-binding domain-containing protein, partial [Parachlamydiaceae bacterium]|nr:LysM peptidoglycan-binding domain-containing protein [Parachlamydiaceae bacterium]